MSYNAPLTGAAGAIAKAIALALTRTKPFPVPKMVAEGNPSNEDKLYDMWTDNAEVSRT